MMATGEIQEILALTVVAAVVAVAVWRWLQRRSRTRAGCNSCGEPASKAKEVPLRFYRRRP